MTAPAPAHLVAKAVELYRRGYSLEACGKLTGLGATTVRKHLHRLGEPMRRAGARKTELSDAQVRVMIRRYTDGASLAQVGAAENVSADVADRILREHGVTIRPRGGVPGPRAKTC